MSKVNADVEALRTLLEKLTSFIHRQKEALEAAEREINITIRMLSESERHWRFQIEERRRVLEQCNTRAARAAAQGHSVDCSSYARALREAEERLKQIQSWQRRVDESVVAYHRAKYRIVSLLDHDMSQARSFLNHRIQALDAYLAAHISSSSSSYSLAASTIESSIGTMIGSVISAVQASQREIQQVLGSVGEEVAVQVLSARFGLQMSSNLSGTHGFEQVFNAPGMSLVVVQPQASKGGFEQVIEHRLAQLAQSLSMENMPRVAVVTGPSQGLADVYARRDNGTWQLLKSDVDLKKLSSLSPEDLTASPKLYEHDPDETSRKG